MPIKPIKYMSDKEIEKILCDSSLEFDDKEPLIRELSARYADIIAGNTKPDLYFRKIEGYLDDIPSMRLESTANTDITENSEEKNKSSKSKKLKVFLCHSSEDKQKVRSLYNQLLRDGMDPWLDEENLLPGQEWQIEIPKAVRNSDVVIVCLSKKSITKAGYIQKELRYALDVAEEQPEGTIFIIPIKLEECIVPERLRQWQWVNLFDNRGYDRLMRSLNTRSETII